MHAQAHEKNVIGLNDRALLPSPPRTVDDTGLHVFFLVELTAKILFALDWAWRNYFATA